MLQRRSCLLCYKAVRAVLQKLFLRPHHLVPIKLFQALPQSHLSSPLGALRFCLAQRICFASSSGFHEKNQG